MSQSRLYGGSVDFNVTAAGVNLSYQWWKDGTSLFQRTNATLMLANLQAIDAGNDPVAESDCGISLPPEDAGALAERPTALFLRGAIRFDERARVSVVEAVASLVRRVSADREASDDAC